ncbi:MAG: DUF4331 family protein [Gemmatimonadetes bacterium]|nr:DUF4331 family protein [Gemmatimonadota bacterium]
MRTLRKLAVALALVVAVAACGDDDVTAAGPDFDRVYDQIDRLGNPLVSEVTLAKRNHGFHNSGSPSTDLANHKTELEAFVTGFGRSTTLAQTLSGVLLPDMLIVQTDKAANTSGWLTWALANGYGGRNLADDVVDAGLAAIFGTLLDPNNALPPEYQTDNVGANNKPFLATFPYLATAN